MWKYKLQSLIGIFCLVFGTAYAQSQISPPSGFMPMGSEKTGGIVDLALIYQGCIDRIDWTKEQFAPYLTWTNPDTQNEEWLFDGFLFLEYESGFGYGFSTGFGRSSKASQQWYLDRIFEKDKSVHALDEVLGETIARLGQPPIPRRVVLTLPDPILDTKNWGELDGREISFDNTEDRIAAVKWFTDQLMSRWNEAGFKNLQLAGFYWMAEKIWDKSDEVLANAVGDDIRSRGKRFYWIPYWNAAGSHVWQELGFDVAYIQPNYFFKLDRPDDRVQVACDFGKNRGMGMEMEWNVRIFVDTENFAPRMAVYLDVFEEAGVWETAAVAHFMSIGEAMIALSQTKNPELRKLYERYCRILSRRQLAARSLFVQKK